MSGSSKKVVQFTPAKKLPEFEEADDSLLEVYATVLDFSECSHLVNYKVKLVFTNKEMKSKGKRVLGKAMACNKREKFLHGHDFVIIIDKQFWEIHEDMREPLLMHEMLHCGQNEDESATTIPHDLEEFGAVVRRYGLWRTDVKHFSNQLQLGITLKASAEG